MRINSRRASARPGSASSVSPGSVSETRQESTAYAVVAANAAEAVPAAESPQDDFTHLLKKQRVAPSADRLKAQNSEQDYQPERRGQLIDVLV